MAAISPTSDASPGSDNLSPGQTYRGPFAIMTSLFFLWGFMTVVNDVLIPRFKEACTLGYFEAMLVQFAFFGAYFIGALLYFVISASPGDPIAKMGYKNGVVIGLLISATGSALFWLEDAVQLETFMKGEVPEIRVPGSERTLSYDPLARIGVGMSRLGTSEAVAIGAYAFALQRLDR